MKKILALTVALMLMLSACAFADIHAFIQTAITDPEGNILPEEVPVFVFTFDDETNACAISNGDETVEGTYEIAAENDEIIVFECTMTDETAWTMTYVIADESFGFEDIDENIHVLMPYTETAE